MDDKLAVIAMTEVTEATLAAHPFRHGVSPDHLAMLARAASDVTFPAGRRFDTIGIGQLVGWSWLFPPFAWAFGAVAASPVETFEFDARTVRAWCASDPALGYEVTRRVAEVSHQALEVHEERR